MTLFMITIGYPPDHIGGTEVYVAGLVEKLQERGHRCVIGYIDSFSKEGAEEIFVEKKSHHPTDVYVVWVNGFYRKLEFIMFDASLREKLLAVLIRLSDEIKPDIIHGHPLQLGLESYLLEALKKKGHRIVLTYHSSTTSCARGDLIYMGRKVCDGALIRKRCTQCFFHQKSVPPPLAFVLSKIPLGVYRFLFNIIPRKFCPGKIKSFLSLPLMISQRFEAWARSVSNADKIVAVCLWVREVILKNNVPEDKVVFSRHGLRFLPAAPAAERSGAAVFGYFGRLAEQKGVHILLRALKETRPSARYFFEISSAAFKESPLSPEAERLAKGFFELEKKDPRIRVLKFVSDEELLGVLAKWDAAIVPSLWLESGPQVVYEAFAAGAPVIGSRLGGIEELVKHGETGFLFPAGDAKELAGLLDRFSDFPEELRNLRKNIPPVRTVNQVAEDMIRLYQGLLAS